MWSKGLDGSTQVSPVYMSWELISTMLGISYAWRTTGMIIVWRLLESGMHLLNILQEFFSLLVSNMLKKTPHDLHARTLDVKYEFIVVHSTYVVRGGIVL